MLTRTGKQCRERYFNHLQPNVKKGDWNSEEDVLILQLQTKIGNQWSNMVKLLPGRTDNAIKNRYHALMKAKALETGEIESSSSYSTKKSKNPSKCSTSNTIALDERFISNDLISYQSSMTESIISDQSDSDFEYFMNPLDNNLNINFQELNSSFEDEDDDSISYTQTQQSQSLASNSWDFLDQFIENPEEIVSKEIPEINNNNSNNQNTVLTDFKLCCDWLRSSIDFSFDIFDSTPVLTSETSINKEFKRKLSERDEYDYEHYNNDEFTSKRIKI